jgi:hypothetical protein
MNDYLVLSKSSSISMLLGEHDPLRSPTKAGKIFTGEKAPSPEERLALFTLLDEVPELTVKCTHYSQKRLDSFASSLGYDNITTLRSAILSSVDHFHAEGVAGQAAWDAEWSAAQGFISSVNSGLVSPTFDNYKSVLPASYVPPDYSA